MRRLLLARAVHSGLSSIELMSRPDKLHEVLTKLHRDKPYAELYQTLVRTPTGMSATNILVLWRFLEMLMIRTSRALLIVAVSAAVAGFVACGTKPTEQAVAPIAPVVAVPTAQPSVTASASAEPTPPAKLPIRSSTPGKVECDNVDCDLATEVCCVLPLPEGGTIGKCVAKPEGAAFATNPCCKGDASYCGNSGMTIERRCDEASDCPDGQRCCAWGALEGDLERDTCDTKCFAERCLSGGTCSSGNRCVAGEDALAGQCNLRIKPPKCGSATCGAAEVCCWNADEKRAHCAENCEEGEDVFACTGPDQCVPYQCNTYTGPARYQCGGDGFMAAVLCQTIKDCPTQLNSLGMGPNSPTVRACKPDPKLPAGLKWCDYE